MHKMVNGERVPLTPEEILEFDAQRVQWENSAPERARKVIEMELAQTDAGIVRGIEDLIEVLKKNNVLTDEQIPEGLKTKLAERKALRSKLRG